MNIVYLSDHLEVVPQLAHWFYQEWAYLHPGWTLAEAERLLSERANTQQLPMAMLAFEDQELLGTVSLKIQDMDTHPELTPWLAGLYVAAPWRRQGIGAKLVAAIEQQALALGVERLYLYTPVSETFYIKLGWQQKEKTEYHHIPVTLMQKNIAAR